MPREYNELKCNVCVALYEYGLSTRQIATLMGWSKTHVAQYIYDKGIGRRRWVKDREHNAYITAHHHPMFQ